MKRNQGQLVNMAVAGLLAAGGLALITAPTSAVAGECHGVNACKGQGACGGKGHGCAGKNACKGMGWIKTNAEECKAKNGTYKADPSEEKKSEGDK